MCFDKLSLAAIVTVCHLPTDRRTKMDGCDLGLAVGAAAAAEDNDVNASHSNCSD